MSIVPSETFQRTRAESLLLETKNALVQFDRVATRKDALAMDELMEVWLDLARAEPVPSAEAPPASPVATLKATRELKLKFMRARFMVRDSESFRSLPPEVRRTFCDSLFEVPPLGME